MIFTIFLFYFSRQSKNNSENCMLIKSNENCMCCNETLKSGTHYVYISYDMLNKILKEYSENTKKDLPKDYQNTAANEIPEEWSKNNIIESQTCRFRQMTDNILWEESIENIRMFLLINNNNPISGVEVSEGNSENRVIEEEKIIISSILEKTENWNKKLTSNQMKEFQRLWINETLYPKGYCAILSKLFHNICFYKLRIEYLTEKNRKLDDLVSIIKQEDLSEIIIHNLDNPQKKYAIENMILAQPASGILIELMREAKSCERAAPKDPKPLRDTYFINEVDYIPSANVSFVVSSKALGTLLINKVIEALIIIQTAGIALDFKKEIEDSFNEEIKNLASNIVLSQNFKLLVKDVLYFIFDNWISEKLNRSLKRLFNFGMNDRAFTITILVFDKIFFICKNRMNKKHENYQKLKSIIGNQSIFYIVLSMMDIRLEFKQLLADYFFFIDNKHDFLTISKFIFHFVLSPLGLTETILLIYFRNEKGTILENQNIRFFIKSKDKNVNNQNFIFRKQMKREFDTNNVSNICLIPFHKRLRVNCFEDNSLIFARNHIPQAQTENLVSEQEIDQILEEALSKVYGYESKARPQAPISQEVNEKTAIKKLFIKFFTKEEIKIVNQLKINIEMKESVISLDQLLLSIESETKSELKAFFDLDDEDQIKMFNLLFSYYSNTGTFPQGHYKLCVMNFKNISSIKFENIFDILSAWFDAILCETLFIENMQFDCFFRNIILIYNNNIIIIDKNTGHFPLNFQLFLNSNNVLSMAAFLSKIRVYLSNYQMASSHLNDFGDEIIYSLKVFELSLINKISERNLNSNTISSTEPEDSRKRQRTN